MKMISKILIIMALYLHIFNCAQMGPLYYPSSGGFSSGLSITQTTTSNGVDWINLGNINDNSDTSSANASTTSSNSFTEYVTITYPVTFISLINSTIQSMNITLRAFIINQGSGSTNYINSYFSSGGRNMNCTTAVLNTATNPNTFNIVPNSIPWNTSSINAGLTFNFIVNTTSNNPRGVAVYYAKLNIQYFIDTSIIGVTPNTKYGYYGNNTVVQISGQNFYNNFSSTPTAVQVKIGSIYLKNVIIVNANTLNVTLPLDVSWTDGPQPVSVSLNNGTTFTTDSVFLSFYQSCPGNDSCSGHGTCLSGNCTCDPGWSGVGCSNLSSTACGNLTNPCNNGTCVGLGVCQCKSGYTGPTCNIINCPGSCSGHGTCVTAGVCTCFPGWNGTNCNTALCTDITNCVAGSCVAPNTCTCTSGWQGSSCNIPVCTVVSCGANGYCSGPNTCSCNPGYTGTTCGSFDCTAQNNCSNHGNCSGPNTCSCDSGYTGLICNQFDCSQKNNNCTNRGTCSAPNTCTCSTGYSGGSCQSFDCNSLNGCNGHGVCSGPSTCSCFSGYRTASCNTFDCSLVNNCGGQGQCNGPNKCTCNDGYNGTSCDKFSCSTSCGNGTCTGPNKCTCNSGFKGPNCDQFDCTFNSDCNSHGTCSAPNTCKCNAGYLGNNCEMNDCTPLNNCSNTNGVCVSPFNCACLTGFTGVDCSLFDCSLKKSCSGSGNCTAFNQCTCFTGFKGDTCSEKDCSVRNDCQNNRSLAIGLGAGLGVGFFLIILLVLLLLIFFLRGGRQEDPKIKKPNFQNIIFPPTYKKIYETEPRENDLKFLRQELVKHLGLVNLITPFIVSKDNLDAVPRSLAYIFQGEPLAVDLFENWVTIEMVSAKSKGTLFRLNSCSTNYYSTFMKTNCLHYLWWVNAILVHEIIQKSAKKEKSSPNNQSSAKFEEEFITMDVASTELNPEELGGEVDELYVKANSYQLLLYLTQLERRIITSTQVMPSDLRRMLRHIHKQVGTKFDSDAQMRSIGGFLILRALNPSLCAPVPYGITQEKISPSSQKELMNISRILQNLSNETSPSEKNKFLAPFDDFVEQEIPKIREFYKELVGNEAQQIDSKSVLQVPSDVEQDSLAIIWNLIYKNKDQIEKNDEDKEFKDLLQRIDKPIGKKEK